MGQQYRSNRVAVEKLKEEYQNLETILGLSFILINLSQKSNVHSSRNQTLKSSNGEKKTYHASSAEENGKKHIENYALRPHEKGRHRKIIQIRVCHILIDTQTHTHTHKTLN